MEYNLVRDKIMAAIKIADPLSGLSQVCLILNKDAKTYNWVGFYFMNNDSKTLHLGPYVGKPTDHEVIPYGKGICGQVAVSGETYVAEDVHAEENYIACSLDVRSEIVVPIYLGNELVAQLDIDSETPNAFSKEDEVFLEELCKAISERYGKALRYEEIFRGITDPS